MVTASLNIDIDELVLNGSSKDFADTLEHNVSTFGMCCSIVSITDGEVSFECVDNSEMQIVDAIVADVERRIELSAEDIRNITKEATKIVASFRRDLEDKAIIEHAYGYDD